MTELSFLGEIAPFLTFMHTEQVPGKLVEDNKAIIHERLLVTVILFRYYGCF